MLEPLYVLDEGEDSLNDAKEAIKEILAQDPRAAKRRGKFDDKLKIEPYKISFGSIQIEFLVSKEGHVEVMKISEAQLDGCVYVDGVPLSKAGIMSWISELI